jgi:hypothetical protein
LSAIHQESHNGRKTSAEYRIFISARQRCENANNKDYANYGGRGIKFLFNSFFDFLKEVGRRPSSEYSLDRIKVDEHYEAGNVRWATQTEQQQNRRNNRMITVGDTAKTQVEWARQTGISPDTLHRRRKRGWCEMCTITIPLKGSCSHRG